MIAAPHFSLLERDGSGEYTVQGTLEDNEPVVTAFVVRRGESKRRFDMGTRLPDGGALEDRRAGWRTGPRLWPAEAASMSVPTTRQTEPG